MRGDEGYALAEVAVEILLVSLTAAILAFAVGSGTRALSRYRDRALSDSGRVRFERALVEAVGSVAPPWFSDPRWYEGIEESGGTGEYAASIPWVGGDPEGRFDFGNDAEGTWIAIGSSRLTYVLPGFTLSLERDREDVPQGLRLSGPGFEATIPFGPLPENYPIGATQ